MDKKYLAVPLSGVTRPWGLQYFIFFFPQELKNEWAQVSQFFLALPNGLKLLDSAPSPFASDEDGKV